MKLTYVIVVPMWYYNTNTQTVQHLSIFNFMNKQMYSTWYSSKITFLFGQFLGYPIIRKHFSHPTK